jgi:hypothetical protein
MVFKATNNSVAANAETSKKVIIRASKKGSRVTEERAKARRAKLDAQDGARQREEEEAATHTTQHKKTAHQEVQAKRRMIEILIEAYLQDHIGGNHSAKTLEWHRTALGFMHLFFASLLQRGVGHDAD